MVVLHVVAPAEVGGLERVVQTLACGLRGAGHDVHVAAVLERLPSEHPFLTPLSRAGVGTHPLVLPGRSYARERRAVAELCRRLRPDVVHTHGYRPDVVDAGVPRSHGIPVVTTVHGFTGGGWRNRLYEWVQCRAFRRFDAVVAVSRRLRERLVGAGVPAARVHEVPNAWRATAPPLERAEARRALGLPPDGFVVGWVGRLSAEKGPDVLLDALAAVQDLAPRASVVGDGVERRSLEARARSLRLDDRVAWHGAVPDADALFQAFDAFVLSSRTEGTPMVLFEAMAAGVPIIATRVGGVPDVVSPAEAVLVPPADRSALAAGIRAVYADPAAARARAQCARERLLRDFSVAPWIARYEDIYRSVSNLAAATAIAS